MFVPPLKPGFRVRSLSLLRRGCALLATLTLFAAPVLAQTSVTFTVSQNSDDADQDPSTGEMWVGDGYGWLDNYVGERFQNVTIPPGATITSASLELFSWGGGTHSFKVSVFTERHDNAPTFPTTAWDLSNRLHSSAQITWEANSVSYVDGQSFSSPNIASAIQEVVDRAGWASGNSLVVILTPVNNGKGYWKRSGNASYAPRLHVTYTDASPLLLHWKLDETSGATADDASTHARDGAVSGATSWAEAQRDNGLTLGSGGKVSLASELDEPGSFTIAGWADTTAHDTHGATVLTVGDAVALLSHSVAQDAPSLAFWNGSALEEFGASGGSTVGTGWRHYAATFDGATRAVRLYVDGELVGTATSSGNPSYTVGSQTTAGDEATPYYSTALTGALDDIRVYDYAMSQAEVVELYGLVGHWDFNDGAGTTATDSSPNANDAGFNDGAPQWTDGVRGGALYFDGASDAVTAADFDPPEEGCVAFWIRCDAEPAVRQRPFGNGNAYECFQNPDGRIYFDLCWSGSPDAMTPAEPFDFNSRWRHVAVNYRSSTDEFEVYVDGELDVSGVYGADLTKQPAAAMTFGCRAGTGQYFTGALDDFRIYSHWLTQKRVAELYGLVGHWKLDEGSGSVAADSSPAGRHGTYTGGMTLGAGGPYPGEGDVAAEFDGANGHVDLPDIDVDFSDGLAIACWAKPTDANHWDRFLELGNGGGNDNLLLARNTDTNHLVLDVYNSSLGGTHRVTASDAIVNDAWSHYVAVIDGDGVGTLYRNGVALASSTLGFPASVTRTNNFIGRSNWTGDGFFEGGMRDVRLYNRPLSAAQVAELYGLVGRWKLDESSGGVAYDSSGYDAHGAYAGSVTLGADGPTSSLQAVDFDGASGHVQLPAYGSQFTAGATLMAWARPVNYHYWSHLLRLGNGENADNLVLARKETTTDLAGTLHNGSLSAEVRMFAVGELDNDVWRHYAFTIDSTGLGTLYVDGEVVATQVVGTPGDVSRAVNYLARSPFAVDGYYEGRLHDARVYNRAVSGEEVTAAYAAGKSPGLRIIRWVEVR